MFLNIICSIIGNSFSFNCGFICIYFQRFYFSLTIEMHSIVLHCLYRTDANAFGIYYFSTLGMKRIKYRFFETLGISLASFGSG